MEGISRNLFFIAPFKTFQNIVLWGDNDIKSIQTTLITKLYGKIPANRSIIKIFSLEKRYWIAFCLYTDSTEAFSGRKGQHFTYGAAIEKKLVRLLNLEALFYDLSYEAEQLFQISFLHMFPYPRYFELDMEAYDAIKCKIAAFQAQKPCYMLKENSLRIKRMKKPAIISHPFFLERNDLAVCLIGSIVSDLALETADLNLVVCEASDEYEVRDGMDLCICQSMRSYEGFSKLKLARARGAAVLVFYK